MPKRVLKGIVVSDKLDKTITVLVSRKVMHPVYKNILKNQKNIQHMMKIINSKMVN